MRTRLLFSIFLLSFPLCLSAQKHLFSMGAETGMNRILWNRIKGHGRAGFHFATLFNYQYKPARNVPSFNLGLLYGKEHFQSRIEKHRFLRHSQVSLTLRPLTSININQNLLIYGGFNFEFVLRTTVSGIFRDGSTYNGFSDQSLYKNHDPENFQTAIVTGIGLPLGERKKIEVDFLYRQSVVPFLNSDFIYETVIGDYLLFSKEAKPSSITLSVKVMINDGKE